MKTRIFSRINGRKGFAPLPGIIALLLASFLLASLGGCAPPSLPLYLEVWDASVPAPAKTQQPLLLLQPFDASVAAKPIGELSGWQSSQPIKVDQQALSHSLTTKFERQLALQGLTAKIGRWDGTLAGMEKIAPGYRAVFRGTIRLLQIDSKKQGLQTVSQLRLVVGCRIGLAGRQTLLTRKVDVSEESTNILQQTSVLEDLLHQGLEDVAKQLAAELKNAITAASPGEQQ